MDNYNVLLNEINEYLNKEEVQNIEANNEIISAYDLYNIVSSELVEFSKKFSKLKKLYVKQVYIPFFYSAESLDIDLEANGSSMTFVICFDDSPINPVIIKKDINSNDIYFGKYETNYCQKIILKFIRKNYDLILDTFIKYENYIKIRKYCEKAEKIEFIDDLFKIEITHKIDGNIDLNLGINPDHPLSQENYKKWLKQENIPDFVNKNKEEILKRFIINPHHLKGSYKIIYDNYKENLESKDKVKSLTKQKFWKKTC